MGAMSVPQTIDQLLRDPSPGLRGRFKIDLDGYRRSGVLESLMELLCKHHGPGTLEWRVVEWGVVEWTWELQQHAF